VHFREIGDFLWISTRLVSFVKVFWTFSNYTQTLPYCTAALATVDKQFSKLSDHCKKHPRTENAWIQHDFWLRIFVGNYQVTSEDLLYYVMEQEGILLANGYITPEVRASMVYEISLIFQTLWIFREIGQIFQKTDREIVMWESFETVGFGWQTTKKVLLEKTCTNQMALDGAHTSSCHIEIGTVSLPARSRCVRVLE